MKKKILSILLCATMIFSFFPSLGVRAEEISVGDMDNIAEEIDEETEQVEASIPNTYIDADVSIQIGQIFPYQADLLASASTDSNAYSLKSIEIQEVLSDGTVKNPYGEMVKGNTTYKVVATLQINSGSSLTFAKSMSGTIGGYEIGAVESWESSGKKVVVSATKKTAANYVDYGVKVGDIRVTSDNLYNVIPSYIKDENGEHASVQYNTEINELSIWHGNIDGNIIFENAINTYVGGKLDSSKKVIPGIRRLSASGDVRIAGSQGVICYAKTLYISSGTSANVSIEGQGSSIVMFGEESELICYGALYLELKAKGFSGQNVNAVQTGSIQGISTVGKITITAEATGSSKAYATNAKKIVLGNSQELEIFAKTGLTSNSTLQISNANRDVYINSVASATNADIWNGVTEIAGYKYLRATKLTPKKINTSVGLGGTVELQYSMTHTKLPDVTKVPSKTGVYVNAVPGSGYIVKEVTVKTKSGLDVSIKDNAFTMPNEEVTVYVTFEKLVVNITSCKLTNVVNDTRKAFQAKANATVSGSSAVRMEYSWYAVKEGKETKIRDWSTDSTISWIPSDFVDYAIYARVRVSGDTSTGVKSDEATYNYHPEIKGICQLPYAMIAPGQPGYLIGIETYEDTKAASVEMLILDCSVMQWVYATGKNPINEMNCLWTVWQPQYGFYWTLFRAYDKDGNIIDECCYGFQNI